MRLLRLLLQATVVALCAVAPASALVGGSPDGNAHPYAGLVGDGTAFCSGALVSPTVFVTAAHCFADGENVLVSFDPAGLSNPTRAEVSGTFHADPHFCVQCGTGIPRFDAHDIGVVRLSAPVTGVSRFASLPSVDQSQRLGKKTTVTVVGYGVQAIARGGGNPTIAATGSRVFATAALGNAGASTAASLLKLPPATGVCNGDSGGPVLSDDTILGTVAFLSSTFCGSDAFAYRLDTADELTFVRSYMS
jgi:secreted trypsin-like serine protease